MHAGMRAYKAVRLVACFTAATRRAGGIHVHPCQENHGLQRVVNAPPGNFLATRG